MKLLFDQNLSNRLVSLLDDLYPGSLHVREVGMKEADDENIWDYAKAEDFIIVSKDSDFHQKSFLRGHPPKVIWLRVGNCHTNEIVTLLQSHLHDIEIFHSDPEASFLALS
jgi:predicted nuclease of predicted toxin-antitoxin system